MAIKSALVILFIALIGDCHSKTATLFADGSSDQIINIDFTSNFTKIIDDTRHIFPDRRTPQVATFSYWDSEKGMNTTVTGMARARGWDRLKQCEIPPLKFEVDKSDANEGTLFEGAKGLKLVTSCYKPKEGVKRRWVMREYIVYKLYQLVTPYSYRVRAVTVNYKHNNGSLVWPWAQNDFGYLIENQGSLAKRNGLTKKEIPEKTGMDWRRVDFTTYLKLSLFQYMLNNTDFAIRDNDMRNIDIIENKTTGAMYPVPFDFDQAEFVRMDKTYSQNTKRWESDGESICFNWNNVQQVIPFYKSLQFKFLSEIDRYKNLNYLNSNEAAVLKAGINNFYQMMDNGELKYVVDRTWKKNGCNH